VNAITTACHDPQDDLTLANAGLWIDPQPFPVEDSVLKTAILLAWENGDIGGAQAFDQLHWNDLIDYDQVISLMIDEMRKKAG
jgi:hypothetical protein